MGYDVRVEPETRTIVITGTGSGTTEDTLRMIAESRQTFAENGGFNLLYDASQLQIDSSPADMMRVAEALFNGSAGAFGRIAVVVPEAREPLAKIFAALADPHGVSANVFIHVNDARRWLAGR